MEIINFESNLDIYEVEKQDYDSYFYRLPKNEIMKVHPKEGFIAYKDLKDEQSYLCGIYTEQIMAMPANRYFIFNLMNEERLGPHKAYRHIVLEENEYMDFLKRLQEVTSNGKDRKEDA